MSDEMDFAPDIYTLVDEEGNEQAFELLDEMEVNENRYFALIPVYDDADEMLEDNGEFVVLRAEIIDGEEMMVSIDDDDEYEHVGNMFLEKIAEIYENELEEVDRNLQ